MFRIAIASLGTLLLAASASAGPETVEEIEACMEANQPSDTAIQTIGMISTDRVGSELESRAKMYWKEFDGGLSRVLMQFSDPPDLRSAGMLLIQKEGDRSDMFMYLPELKKVKRISGHMISGSMFGLDFSYEDFERLQGLSKDGETTRLADVEISGRPAYQLSTTPDAKGDSGYERIVDTIDKASCLVLESKMYEKGDRLRKVFKTGLDGVEKREGKWYAKEVTMQDLRDETSTRIVIEELEVGVEINRKMFSQRALESSGR